MSGFVGVFRYYDNDVTRASRLLLERGGLLLYENNKTRYTEDEGYVYNNVKLLRPEEDYKNSKIKTADLAQKIDSTSLKDEADYLPKIVDKNNWNAKAEADGSNVDQGSFKANLSLENVDNTSDADKPVSTAQASAINEAESSAIETSVNASSTNMLRNSGFNILGALEPFRSDQSASSVVVYDGSGSEQSVANIQCNDTNYHYIGQKIYLPVKLARATKFSLSFEIISSNIANMDNIQVSVFAWDSDVAYSTIASSAGLNSVYAGNILWKENGSGNTDLGTVPSVFSSANALKKFENFEAPADTRILYVQFRFRASSAGLFINNMIDKIMLNEGTKSVTWKQHPEDDIENRGIGLASHIVNQLFTLDSSGKIKLKTDLYALDGTTKIINASTAKANTVEEPQTGSTTSTAYTSYDDTAT